MLELKKRGVQIKGLREKPSCPPPVLGHFTACPNEHLSLITKAHLPGLTRPRSSIFAINANI